MADISTDESIGGSPSCFEEALYAVQFECIGAEDFMSSNEFSFKQIPSETIISCHAENSIIPSEGHGVPSEVLAEDAPSTTELLPHEDLSPIPKAAPRFSSASAKILKTWLREHNSYPYANAQDVARLESRTGLTKRQILTWLANARQREKVKQPQVSPSLVIGKIGGLPAVGATRIPPRCSTPAPFDDMNPLERWKNSPPENEAASVFDISCAVTASMEHSSSDFSAFEGFSDRAGSIASDGKVHPSQESASSNSMHSHSSTNSFRLFGSLRAMDNRIRRRKSARRFRRRFDLARTYHTYQCTFCTETFKTKHDWQRHEKSMHLSLEQWVCSPNGSTVLGSNDEPICVYCGEVSPDMTHLDAHNQDACIDRQIEDRTFYRKDHLLQHLKVVHSMKFMTGAVEQWKVTTQDVRSKCGFCGSLLESWPCRVEHLAVHFKEGRTMANWEGDWGFEPQVIEMLENAMPPYLISYEQNSPYPFSAIKEPTSTPTSAYTLLKLELEYFTRGYVDAHKHSPPDHELQHEGCSIIFGAEDQSGSDTSASMSWLRDIFMSSYDIAKQARLRPLRKLAKTRRSQLTIVGKRNIFDDCELEQQLCRYIGTYLNLNHESFNCNIQQEACKIICLTEASSGHPSKAYLEFLLRLIWNSCDWISKIQQRVSILAKDKTNLVPFSWQNHQHGYDPILNNHDVTKPSPLRLAESHELAPNSSETHFVGIEGIQSISSHTHLAIDFGLEAMPAVYTSPDGSEATPGVRDPLEPWRWHERDFMGNCMPFGLGEESHLETHTLLNDVNSYRHLTTELARFVASTISSNNPSSHIPTDDELRYQARWILYDDDDPWNQTPADNKDWLNDFKQCIHLVN